MWTFLHGGKYRNSEIFICNSLMTMTNTNPVAGTKTVIKQEGFSDEIKDFAETAMSELLGWYGYENGTNREKVLNLRNGHEPHDTECENLTKSSTLRPTNKNLLLAKGNKSNEDCKWCGKAVKENGSVQSGNSTYCSESCFSQARRANFKKSKKCDWCKHNRHFGTVIDSQDGDSQLQFCSDKCLNQYKMHIFWGETNAHLQLHPHHHYTDPNHLVQSESALITPELWLGKGTATPPPAVPPQIESIPIINVTPPAKLMPKTAPHIESYQKRERYHRSNTGINGKQPVNNGNTVTDDLPQDLRIRHTPPPPQTPQNASDSSSSANNTIFSAVNGLVPPPTLMVPYPIVLPLPLPIPIPIPIDILSKAKDLKTVSSQTDDSRNGFDTDLGKSNRNECTISRNNNINNSNNSKRGRRICLRSRKRRMQQIANDTHKKSSIKNHSKTVLSTSNKFK